MILVCIVIEPSTRSIAPVRELFRNLVVDLRIQSREELQNAPDDTPKPDLLLICDNDGPTALETLGQLSRISALQQIRLWVASPQQDREFCDACFTLGASDVLHFPFLQSELQPKMLTLLAAHAHTQIQNQLKTREATLKEALYTGRMAYWEIDLETRIYTFNDAFYRLLRVDVASVGGYKMSTHDYANRFLHPEDRHLISDYTEISLRNPELMVFHELSYRFVHGDGTPGTMFLRYSLRRDAGVLKAFGISRDITEETEREKLTRDYKRRLEATQAGINAANFGIYQINGTGYIRFANDHAVQLTGFSREELQSMHVTELDAMLDLEKWKHRRRMTQKEGAHILETQHRCKDGSLLDVEVTVHPFFHEGKRSTFSFVRDLTERNRQSQRLAESQERFDSVLMSVSSLGVMGIDQDLRIFFWNPANEEVYGYRAEEVIGKKVVDLVVPDAQRTHAVEVLEEAFRTGTAPAAAEATLQRRDGRSVTVFSNRALVHADGRAELYCIDLDLSEAKAVANEKERVFQDMLEAKEVAERANRSKDEFLAVMSHEMRTPLNPILGFSNILRKECTPEQNEYITIIYQSAERLRNLISEILDYIRLGKGDIQPKMAVFNLLELCQTSFLDARQQSQSKGLQLSFNNGFEQYLAIPGSCSVRSDSHMILRILDNLLINACKYTPAGKIDLNIGMTPPAEPGSCVRFVASVVDTGIGIDSSSLVGIFDPFTQADSSYARKSEGVGLGLSICKKLIDLLGGSIAVESQPTEGSCFRIQIPVETLSTPELLPGDTPAFQWHQFADSPTVLIVDDTPNNAKIAGIMVGKMGCRSQTASDGKVAISRCATEAFDLILMDLSMPVMDGLVATRELRSKPGPNQHTPVLGLSAHVSQSVREQCKQAGMDGYVEKPIHAEELQVAIVDLLAQRRTATPPLPSANSGLTWMP